MRCNGLEESANRIPGANPSAEDAEEALEDGAKIVNDVADAFGLIEIKTGFNRATYLAYIRV